MPLDQPLADAVAAFRDALAPPVRSLATPETGVDPDRVADDVLLEAYNLAVAFIDADDRHTDAELWALISTFGPEIGGALHRATPDAVRSSGLLTDKKRYLDRPSTILELLTLADGRDGSRLGPLYYQLAIAIGFTIASLDDHTSPEELAAIERFRAMVLATIGNGPDRPAGSATAATGAGAPNTDAAAPNAVAAAAAAEEPLEPPRPVEEVLAELDRLIGLAEVKAEVTLVADLTRVQQLRAERGLPVVDGSRHLVFSGNPGTGKTTVARLLAEIFRSLGVVERGHLVEVDRSGLVAGFVGQTATKVVEVFDRADQGMLLIDEAYSLVRGSESDFGREAIDTIVKLVEDRRDRLVVVMAGYPDEMTQLVEANPGLRSRFPKAIFFPDYTTDELLEIFGMHCDRGGYLLGDDARTVVRERLDGVERGKGFGNGRVSRNLFEAAVARQASRVVRIDDPTDVELTTLLADDIPPVPDTRTSDR